MQPHKYHWDEMKIGPGATPIKTEKGWLNIYHGVFETMAGSVYRLGVALHDPVPAEIRRAPLRQSNAASCHGVRDPIHGLPRVLRTVVV